VNDNKGSTQNLDSGNCMTGKFIYRSIPGHSCPLLDRRSLRRTRRKHLRSPRARGMRWTPCGSHAPTRVFADDL